MSDAVLIVTIPAVIAALSGAVAALWKWLTTRGMVRERSTRRVSLSDETVELYKQIIAAHERTIDRLERELGRRTP